MTTTAVQPELDFASALAYPWPPSRVDFRDEVARAVMAVAFFGDDVHVSNVRSLLRKDDRGRVGGNLGATFAALITGGYLVPTGQYRRNGDAAARNAGKASPLYRLMKAIPTTWAEQGR